MGADGRGQRLATAGLLPPWFRWILGSAAIALLIYAVLNDYRRRGVLNRHWSHWAGVLAGAAKMTFELVGLWFV
jgi:hypothetical protein